MNNAEKPLTILDLADMKRRGTKIACLTAYDASFASLLDQAGVDVILVGDSLGMVIQGHGSTLPVTMDDMVYHTRCVSRGRRRAFVIADMPFMSYPNSEVAAENAARLMREGGARMVKLEGGRNRRDAISHMVAQGIPVCGHLGLQPQSINQLGGYRVQGRGRAAATAMREDAQILQDAGATMLVLECVPAGLAEKISVSLTIPVIGIGAGIHCDGQVLVLYDILGVGGGGRRPRFCKDFMAQTGNIVDAVEDFVDEVRGGRFPTEENQY
ncbi:MAG: 3-methyl-2-oxobutanoate hydroxymethyltransferase [Pseudomonadota bacterium]